MAPEASARRSGRGLTAPLLALCATLPTLPLVMGYWGALHPAFDALVHFRIHLAAVVVLAGLPLLLFQGWRRIGLTAMVLGLTAIATTLALPIRDVQAWARVEPANGARYRLLQLNLRYDNRTPKQVLSLIGRVEPDVITLEEVSAMWREEIALLRHAYPHQIICPPPTPVGGVAILSRRPFLHPSRAQCLDRGALAIATVNFGGTAVDVAALHLGWPWPFEQPWQIPRVSAALQQLSETAILAGDLNAVPWSITARRIAAAGGLARLEAIGPSWLARPLPNALRRTVGLPIDNILVKGRLVPLDTRRLDDVGSDHLPVLLEFSVQPDTAPREMMQARLRQ
ncbi:endonuclease/exonuclease/phosphatase family protein [Chelativorans sp. M5D2P16]|uniref:endonuclease/exonuclease/phosphatase family protein n=1 Tax=Chelativorans sp. M5D2P16 TaxID=3095678 RepID=UPI002ACA6944|nr:endonuclease/exonuclease/phosphatase family protein [Chelativorans sp. M5D2P16]MDZ5698334.1 endonuclease/exonuclease/phosphatase family protein [Chelativorans sp. M5D2P16]